MHPTDPSIDELPRSASLHCSSGRIEECILTERNDLLEWITQDLDDLIARSSIDADVVRWKEKTSELSKSERRDLVRPECERESQLISCFGIFGFIRREESQLLA